MIKVGVTGGIGAGKSIVSSILMAMNFSVFNSDTEAKRIVDTDLTVRDQLIELFGEDIYNGKELDRVKLATYIFENEELRAKVNSIIHPAVRAAFDQFCRTAPSTIVFNEAAILFETGSYKQFDATILVTAPEELRVHRVVERDHVTPQDVLKRMNVQWSDVRKSSLADYIIINDDKQPVLSQIETIIGQLISS